MLDSREDRWYLDNWDHHIAHTPRGDGWGDGPIVSAYGGNGHGHGLRNASLEGDGDGYGLGGDTCGDGGDPTANGVVVRLSGPRQRPVG